MGLVTLPYGTQRPVGLYHATSLAEIDYETFSQAGMVWTGEKWVGPPGAPKNSKGLPVVGVVNYTEHPSFEVLVAKYDLKDGFGPRTWRPGEPNPQPLFDHIARGGLLEAHNAGFERRVWKACQRLYGWPPMPFHLWRCSAAKSRAWGRPGGLDAAAAVASTARKDPAGERLIRDLTMPRKPTKSDPSFRLTRQSAPEKFAALDAYCEQDIVAEAELSIATPDLPPPELEYWQVDQAINERGVAVDVPLIEAGIKIVNAAQAKYGDEVKRLTGGIAATEVSQLSGWCAGAGYPMAAMDEDAISAAVSDPACPPLVRQVLDLRAKIASASVKKLFAMRNTVSSAGRIHDLFIFHGARTGRCTGDGPQPTNFPKAGPNVWRCQCGRHYGESRPGCPWCGAGPEARVDHKGGLATSPSEWSPEAMNDAITVVRTGCLNTLELFFGEALLTIAGCLRGTFIAAPGHDLVSSDWTAIEAVVLACLAGEQWRIDLFREGGKIYEASGAKVGGVEYESLLEHKKRTGQHHPLRQVGKTCFTADTIILTDNGPKAIINVTTDDRVWDGYEWVEHDGLIRQGVKRITRLDSVGVTPDHVIYLGEGRTATVAEIQRCREALGEAYSFSARLLPPPNPHARRGRSVWLLPLDVQPVYDLVNAGPRHRFTILTDVGPLIVSNCELALGYQGWVGAWRAFDPNGVQTDDELKQIILAWRKASPAVVEFWGGQSRRRGYETVEEYFGVEGAFIQAILNPGKVFDCRGLKFQMEGRCVYITLLSGRRIAYHDAQLHQSDKPGSRYAISYWGWNTNPKNGPRGWIQIRTWGGRLCIAEGTPVLTLDGWKPIEDITALDSVWDGVEWVSCDGAICNGEKETIEAYGAWMTPDHQVLTTEGWRDGEEKGLQRADARIPDGYWPEGDQRQAGALGIQVRLRGGEDNRGPRHSEDDNPQRQGVLRVHEAEDYFREADRPRDEPPPGVCCVGVDEGPMPPPNARSVAAIRRARDNGLPALAGELREFLGGHGADISARVGDRPQGQQRRVLPGELPMGGFTDAEREPPRQRSVGRADGGGDCPADGPTKVDGVLPHEGGGDAGANAGETKRRQKVYDVMNCGPRNRFTIWAGGDGLIVHNCENIVQATSNDLLRFASVNLERAGYPIVLHVYDEIVAEVPQGRGSVEELEAWMRYTPDWATCADGQKWPVGAAGGWRADRYRKG